MGIPIIGDVIDAVGSLVSEVIVDKDKKKELEFKLEELKVQADERFHKELMGQIEINKIEAAHPSIFVAGWRPFIGWVGGASIAYTFVIAPLAERIALYSGFTGDLPALDTGSLMTLVLAILGIGAQRSFDKTKGVDTKSTK